MCIRFHNFYFRTPLHYACARGHVGVVTELLEWVKNKKVNVGDADQKTPLMKVRLWEYLSNLVLNLFDI